MGAATMEEMVNQISAVDGSTGDAKIHLMLGKGAKKKKNHKNFGLTELIILLQATRNQASVRAALTKLKE